MEMKFKKVTAGEYEIFIGGELVGLVWGGSGSWFAKTHDGEIVAIGWTRKEAAEMWMAKYKKEQLTATQPKESTFEEMTPEDEIAAEITGELNKKISAKIKPVFDGPVAAPYRIGCSSGSWELKGSKQLDFIEFMYIYSDGSVICNKSFNQLCEAYAEGDGDCGPDSHADNFADCFGDYFRAWKKANEGNLCGCCKGEGTILKDMPSGLIARAVKCPECQGYGLQVEKEIQEEKIPECDLCGDTGRVADDILCWKCEEPLEVSNPYEDVADYSKTVRQSLHSALWDIKESGETRVQDEQLEQMVILELLEMGISVIRYQLDDVIVIEQNFEEDVI